MSWWLPVISALGGVALGASSSGGSGQQDKAGTLSSGGIDVLTSKKQTITYTNKTNIPVDIDAKQYTTTDSRSFQYAYNPNIILNSPNSSLSSSPSYSQTPTTSVVPSLNIVPTIIPTQDVNETSKKSESTGSWESMLPYIAIGLGAFVLISATKKK